MIRLTKLTVALVLVLTPACAVVAANQLDESQAIAEIERLGGKVERDDKSPGRPVTEVNFIWGGVGDSDLRVLRTFKNLTTLKLEETKITDAGLKDLGGLKSLKTLSLTSTHIRDAGLTHISDAGLKELKELNNLNGAGISALPRSRMPA